MINSEETVKKIFVQLSKSIFIKYFILIFEEDLNVQLYI